MAESPRLSSFRSRRATRRLAGALYKGVFADSPNPYLVLTPELDIVDANDAYLSATMRDREQLAGLNMFEAFPDNPAVEKATGVRNLRTSLEFARAEGARDTMPLQRYDVTDPQGVWQMRYWRPVNWPIADDQGQVIALVHHVIDATDEVSANSAGLPAFDADDLIRRADASCAFAEQLCDKVRADLHAAVRRTQLRTGGRRPAA